MTFNKVWPLCQKKPANLSVRETLEGDTCMHIGVFEG